MGPTQATVGQYWGNSRITYSAPDPSLRLYDVRSIEVLEGPQGKFVFVVGKENKAEIRPVEAGEWTGGDVVISKGLASGDQVIVDGVVKLGPGAPVQISAPAPAGQAAPASNAKQGG